MFKRSFYQNFWKILNRNTFLQWETVVVSEERNVHWVTWNVKWSWKLQIQVFSQFNLPFLVNCLIKPIQFILKVSCKCGITSENIQVSKHVKGFTLSGTGRCCYYSHNDYSIYLTLHHVMLNIIQNKLFVLLYWEN